MENIEAITLNQMLKIQLKFNNKVIKISQFNHMSAVPLFMHVRAQDT